MTAEIIIGVDAAIWIGGMLFAVDATRCFRRYHDSNLLGDWRAFRNSGIKSLVLFTLSAIIGSLI